MASYPYRTPPDSLRQKLKGGLIALVAVLLALIGWRIIATSSADRLAHDAPLRALAWDPSNPAALVALAEAQLAERQWAAAAATARALLRTEPLQAQAFVIMAAAARAGGDVQHASVLDRIALRRAPKDPRARVVAIDTRLSEGNYAAAMAQIETLLRISPAFRQRVLPILVQLADTPAFADALAHSLSANPPWRTAVLAALLAQGSRAAWTQVYSAVQRDGALTQEEAGRWLDRLAGLDQWGEAYSRWVGTLSLPSGTPLVLVHNGGFEQEPTQIGFDWRIRNSPGVIIERVQVNGASGASAARISFAGRRVPTIEFEQNLLLGAGTYQLGFRALANDLRSEKGLEWAISCTGAARPFAVSPRLQGTFAWKAFTTQFNVPAEHCPAQRLWLRNPGSAGSGKIVSGDVWFDDFAIDSASSSRVIMNDRPPGAQ